MGDEQWRFEDWNHAVSNGCWGGLRADRQSEGRASLPKRHNRHPLRSYRRSRTRPFKRGIAEASQWDREASSPNESSRRIFRQRAPEHGWISWDQSAVVIDRFIRAQTRPYPGAYTSLHRRPLRIWRASIVSENDVFAPGGQLMCQESGRYLVACGNGAIELKEISYDQDS